MQRLATMDHREQLCEGPADEYRNWVEVAPEDGESKPLPLDQSGPAAAERVENDGRSVWVLPCEGFARSHQRGRIRELRPVLYKTLDDLQQLRALVVVARIIYEGGEKESAPGRKRH